MEESGSPPRPPATQLASRTVPWSHAVAWYAVAMRLFKFAPFSFIGLALVVIVTELVLQGLPGALVLAGQIVTPLVACALVYACAAADRRVAPTWQMLLLVFRAGGNAIAAIIVASLLTTAAQQLAAWWIADVNLLAMESMEKLSAPAILGVFAIGVLAALPLTFIPMLVLFGRVPLRKAFAASGIAFAQNTMPLLVYGALSLVLVLFGMLTMGAGFALALPLEAAASYAAWKDVFDVRDAPVF